METGERRISPERAAEILSAPGIRGEHFREIVSLAYEADNPPWAGTTLPERARQSGALIEFERAASRITAVSPLLVNGPLQEESYIRAIMTAGDDLLPDEVSERIATRLDRRSIRTRSEPVALRVFLGEAVLHQVIGDRDVVAAQFPPPAAVAAAAEHRTSRDPVFEGREFGFGGRLHADRIGAGASRRPAGEQQIHALPASGRWL